MSLKVTHIYISRTDSIGDVILTLPLCGFLKKKFPEAKITFLCKSYTAPVVESCLDVDAVVKSDVFESKPEIEIIRFLKEENISHFIHVFPSIFWSKWAKKAGTPNRIGTSHRFFHWMTCNKKVNFTRKKSDLHESQLNFKLLKPLGVKGVPSLEKMPELLHIKKTDFDLKKWGNPKGKKVVLHALSQGSATEWGIDNFASLALKLSTAGNTVYFTGTEKEGQQIRNKIPKSPNIIDTTGQMSLAELMGMIAQCDVLVAASTGPLHIAGILGIHAIGLFSPLRPIHPGRWKPLGNKTTVLTGKNVCSSCKTPADCNCMKDITVGRVYQKVIE